MFVSVCHSQGFEINYDYKTQPIYLCKNGSKWTRSYNLPVEVEESQLLNKNGSKCMAQRCYVFLSMCSCHIYIYIGWLFEHVRRSTSWLGCYKLQTEQNWEPSNSTFVNTLKFFSFFIYWLAVDVYEMIYGRRFTDDLT